jgi:hypothetical protein
MNKNISVLKESGGSLVDTGTVFDLPGHPASMRGGPQ